mmetsp:Transcript_36941/g.104240  ORF Transcript_36941/g.104240 Transcript_36941/m.104240 type:complete len:218 (+) Transcript_36941:121-774(+)
MQKQGRVCVAAGDSSPLSMIYCCAGMPRNCAINAFCFLALSCTACAAFPTAEAARASGFSLASMVLARCFAMHSRSSSRLASDCISLSCVAYRIRRLATSVRTCPKMCFSSTKCRSTSASACLAREASLWIAETCICSLLARSLAMPTTSFMFTAGPSTASRDSPSPTAGRPPYFLWYREMDLALAASEALRSSSCARRLSISSCRAARSSSACVPP